MKAARALSRDAPRISEQFCQLRTSWLWFRSEDEDKIKLDSKRGKSWVSKNNATSLTSLSAGFLISLLKSSHFLLLTGPVPFMMILDPPCKNERTYGNYMRVFSLNRHVITRTLFTVPFLTLASMKWSLIMGIRASIFSECRSLGKPERGPSGAPTAMTLWLEDFLLVKQMTINI